MMNILISLGTNSLQKGDAESEQRVWHCYWRIRQANHQPWKWFYLPTSEVALYWPAHFFSIILTFVQCKCKLLWLHDEQGKQAGCHTFICNFPHNCLLSGLWWHILDEEIISIVVHGTLQNALDLLLHKEFVRMQAQADTTTHDHVNHVVAIYYHLTHNYP